MLTRLLHLEEGIRKHSSDPTFPDLSRIGDVSTERELLGTALTKANAQRGLWKESAGAAQAETTRADVLAQKVSHAIQSWAGLRGDALRDFGMRPHKATRKRTKGGTPHTGATGHTRSHTGAAHGAAGSGGGSAPAPTEGSSSSGGGEPAGSASTGAPTGGK